VKGVLITRPRAQAQALAARLRARGIECRVEPMLEIVPRPSFSFRRLRPQAILLTSANALLALAGPKTGRSVKQAWGKKIERLNRGLLSIPVYAVGAATAKAAKALGFANVAPAAGNVDTLCALVRRKLDPARGSILHLAGSATAGDVPGVLRAAGFRVLKRVIYDAKARRKLSAGAIKGLHAGRFQAVLFFSPRTARTFVTLLKRAKLVPCARSMNALCLSRQVADAVDGLPWRKIGVAGQPNEGSLLRLLGA
jgi:uroporphyrinogen-III synthase